MIAPGAPVEVLMEKWGRRPHWRFTALLLGSDEYGTWLGVPAGTPMTRPGATYVAPVAQVMLVPEPAAGHIATFHAPRGPVQVYVDLTTATRLDPDRGILTAVDMDLDVVRGHAGRTWVDDEDEFAAHRARYGYPADLVASVVAACERLVVALRSGTAPFDTTTPAAWFTMLDHLAPSSPVPAAAATAAEPARRPPGAAPPTASGGDGLPV